MALLNNGMQNLCDVTDTKYPEGMHTVLTSIISVCWNSYNC